ncbi:MAG TPA: NAD(P)-dependent oxidoreductase [Candidatus Acidoferrales bacterium]|jgi:dTDP-4-dehydrorhamnose reductase|nr:NAD(P)-dependent oxidoreductase [Candidatus Acidoferrales bacterium]
MRIAITGANGLLGKGLVRVFAERHTVIPLAHAECDITDGAKVREVFGKMRVEAVVHAAAIPDLDICEADPALAFRVNVEGTRNIVEAARETGASVAYISTDAVFDGEKRTPYTESDAANPPTVYGQTKLQAEESVRRLTRHFIFRVPVLFGPGKENFVSKGLRKLANGEEYVVASDQLGGALYTLDGARKMMEVMEAGRFGTFHLTNTGICDRLELAIRAATIAGLDSTRIIGKPSAEMGRRAKRLKYAVMEMRSLLEAGFALPRPWQESLLEFVQDRRAGQV